VEASCFLNESADAAIVKMIESVTVTRSLAGLLACADHRNAAARGKVVEMLLRLVRIRGADLKRCKDMQTLLVRLPKMLAEHNPEARRAAREMVRELINSGLVPMSEMEKYVSLDLLRKCTGEMGDGKPRSEAGNVAAGYAGEFCASKNTDGKSFSKRFSRHFNTLM